MDSLGNLLGNSPAMVRVKEKVQRLLLSSGGDRFPPILIQGETGTGKGLLARMIHAAGPRRNERFVDVNSAAIPESLIEAELFGFERGAFTDAGHAKAGLFQAAHRGTIFLDEIGLVPTSLQAKLLKVIEERAVRRLGSTRSEPVDVWIVAATNEDLATAVRERRFREDLYHRLAVLTLEVPPLRERRADILLLAEEFLASACSDYGLPVKTFAPAARAALMAYAWPGNVRELRNVIERVAVLTHDRVLTAEMLALPADTATVRRSEPAAKPSVSLDSKVETLEQHEVLRALEATRWNVSQAASRLGITRDMIRYRIDKYGLRPGVTRPRRRRPEPAPLAPAATPRKEAPASSPRWERRLVALLEATVRPLAEPGRVIEFNRGLDMLVDKVQSFAGRIEEASPTGIVATFGLEPAEDAPRRAALAAIAIQKAMARAREAQSHQGAVTIAIHADHVTVGQIGGRAQLDADAKRQMEGVLEQLRAHAAPDTIVVSKTARAFLDRQFEFAEAAEPDLSLTFGGRLANYQPLRFGPSGHAAAFVGRQHELGVLRSRWQDVLEGRGHIVALVGDAGIGKSRLLFEFRETLREAKFTYLAGHGESYGSGIPFLPVIDLLKSHFQILEADDAQAILEKVTARLLALNPPLDADLAPTLALLDVPVPDPQWQTLDPPQRRQRMLNAWKRLLLGESQVQPVIVVFEDLHWSDSETRALLESFFASVPAARILLVLSYRVEFQPSWGSRSYYTQLEIGPLPSKNAEEFLQSLLGRDPSLMPLKRLLMERTERNPFFLEEGVRTLAEAKVLFGERGGYQVAGSIDNVQVPDTVQAILAARIDRLSLEDKGLLQAAAVIGKSVPVPLLLAITEVPEEALRTGLARLQAAELLYESSLYSDLGYTFHHPLTHEVAYGGLLQASRRTLHARVVEAIERLYPHRLTEQIDRLAHHAVRGAMWEKALQYLRRAGAKALARSAYREAGESFKQALGVTSHLPESSDTIQKAIDVRIRLFYALNPLGAFDQALSYLKPAESLAKTLGDQRRLGTVSAHMASCFWTVGEPSRAVEYAERALAIGAAVEDVTLQLQASFYLGLAHHAQGEYRRAKDSFTKYVDHPPADLMGHLYSTLSSAWSAWSLAELGEFSSGIAQAEKAVKTAEALGDQFGLLNACGFVGVVLLGKGDLHKAIPPIERSLALSQETRSQTGIVVTAAFLGYTYALSGRLGEAVTLLEQSVTQAERGMAFGHSLWVGFLSQAYLQGGRVEHALERAQLALALSQEHRERGHEAYSLRLLGDIASHPDSPDEETAQSHYRQALALANELSMRPLVAHCHFGLGKLYRRTGKREQAQEHLTTATTIYREMGMTYWFGQAEAEIRVLA
jgi:transcriptional regulator with AAA-type ATPase domain/tetratricopeptide (TPR) repeat protein